MRLGNVAFGKFDPGYRWTCPLAYVSREKPTRIALKLAVAHHIQRLIEEGKLRDYAHAAAATGLSRKEITLIAALAQLSPAIQDVILSGGLSRAGRHLLAVAKWRMCWREQEADLRHFFPRWDRNLSREVRGGEKGEK